MTGRPIFPQVHKLFNPPPAPPSHNYDDGVVDRSCPDKGFTKQPHYFYDAEAVREPAKSCQAGARRSSSARHSSRSLRSVWHLATQPYKGSHTATFPVKLVEPCILAGTSAAGCCARCGQPWKREMEVTYRPIGRTKQDQQRRHADRRVFEITVPRVREAKTIGWRPTCDCDAPTVPAVVLDPFAGTGTTLLVAQQRGRRGVGIELSESYISLIKERLSQPTRPASDTDDDLHGRAA